MKHPPARPVTGPPPCGTPIKLRRVATGRLSILWFALAFHPAGSMGWAGSAMHEVPILTKPTPA